MSESLEHEMVCNYIKENYPEVIFISDASGLKLPIGQATRWARLKSHRGIPDLIILEPRGEFHGLCIEMKRTGEGIIKKDGTYKTAHLQEQAQVLKSLEEKGYDCYFALGFDSARAIINHYMSLSI